MQGKATSTQVWRQLGFTLIELMIVVAIIGILASIAIPLYSQHRTSAMNSAAQSELRIAKTSLEGYFITGGYSYFQVGSPTGIDTLALDFESSDNVEIAYTGTNDTFEMCAWHKKGDRYYSVNSSAQTVTDDECTGTIASAGKCTGCYFPSGDVYSAP